MSDVPALHLTSLILKSIKGGNIRGYIFIFYELDSDITFGVKYIPVCR